MIDKEFHSIHLHIVQKLNLSLSINFLYFEALSDLDYQDISIYQDHWSVVARVHHLSIQWNIWGRIHYNIASQLFQRITRFLLCQLLSFMHEYLSMLVYPLIVIIPHRGIQVQNRSQSLHSRKLIHRLLCLPSIIAIQCRLALSKSRFCWLHTEQLHRKSK